MYSCRGGIDESPANNCETTTDHSWKILRLKTDLSTKTRKEIISKYLVHHGLYAAESWIQDILTSEMTSRHKYLAVLLESLLSLKVFPSMFLHTQTKEDYESGDGALAACVNRKNNQPPVGLVEDSTLALHGLDPKYEAQVHAPSIRLNINNLLSESQHPTQLWEQWLKTLNKRTPLLREALCLIVLSDKGLSDYELSCILFTVPGGGLLNEIDGEAATEPELNKDKPNDRQMSSAIANVRLEGRNKMPPPLRRGSKFHAGGDVIRAHDQASTDSGAERTESRLSSTEGFQG